MSNAKVYVKVYPSDFTINEEGSLRFYEPGIIKNSVSPFIRINPTFFKLEPNEEKWIRFTVKMPKNFNGELHGMIFFQTVPSGIEKARGHQVFLSTRLGAVVYASAKGKTTKIAEISDFYLKENSKNGSIEYSILLKNEGNVHIRPEGNLRILNKKGKKITDVKINEYASPVLREKLRIFKGEIGKNLTPGKYRIITEINYGGKENLEAEKSINILKGAKIEEFRVEFIEAKERKKSQAKEIKDIKVKKLEGGIILTIQGDGNLNYLNFELDNPPRIVIDIKEVENKIFHKKININSNKIKRIRTSQYQIYPEKIARVVIDLINRQKYEILQNMEGLKILIGNIESLKKRIDLTSISKPKIIFTIKAKGVNIEKGLNHSFIKVKNLNGELLSQIPLKIKNRGAEILLEGEMANIPQPGIYFAEAVIFHNGITPLISYIKFTVKK
jgi:P pilus assembly chaperone PapD